MTAELDEEVDGINPDWVFWRRKNDKKRKRKKPKQISKRVKNKKRAAHPEQTPKSS